MQTSAPAASNDRHLAIEGAVFRESKTTSGQLMKSRGRSSKDFILQPSAIDFGTVYSGQVVHAAAKLRNVSAEIARFQVQRPEPPLSCIYKPGPVAAGMESLLTIEFSAHEVGEFTGEVVVRTETAVFSLPVTATVLPAAAPVAPAAAAARPPSARDQLPPLANRPAAPVILDETKTLEEVLLAAKKAAPGDDEPSHDDIM